MTLRRILAALSMLCVFFSPAQAQTGSQKTPAQLNAEINSLFPDQNHGAITPFNLRLVTLDQVASSVIAVTPAQYGAKCDGVADDTVAINNAVLASHRKILSFPAGATCIVQYLEICSNSTCLTGHVGTGGSVPYALQGNGATLKASAAAAGQATFVYVEQQTATNYPNFTMQDLTIDANNLANRGLTVFGCLDCIFTNIKESQAQVEGCHFTGIPGYVLGNSVFQSIQCNYNNTNSGSTGTGIVTDTEVTWMGAANCASNPQNGGNTFINVVALFNGFAGWAVNCANNSHVNADMEMNLSYGLTLANVTSSEWVGAQFSSNRNARASPGTGGDAGLIDTDGTGAAVRFLGGVNDGTTTNISSITCTPGCVQSATGLAGYTLPASPDTLLGSGASQVIGGPKFFADGTAFLNAQSGGGTVQLRAAASAAATIWTTPSANDTAVGKATSDTLTNKSISGSTNTLSAIPTTALSGALQAAQEPAHTGDVTNTAGSLALTLVTAQPAVHTWALAQTFTVAPVFTDASGSRTALGLGTLSTVTPGAGVAAALAIAVGSAGGPVTNGGALGSPSSVGTLPAFTLGGTVSGGGNNINNVNVGVVTPGTGAFTSITGTSVNLTSFLTTGIVTVSLLPTCNSGSKSARLFVTDATAALTAGIGAVVAGGGANNVPIVCDGTNWRIG